MTSKESKILSIRKSKNGKGLFADKNINIGEVVIELRGKLITCYEDDNLDEQTRSNTIRFDSEMFLSPKGEVGELINHSCAPNSKIIKRKNKLFVVSIEQIVKNEEITFDYSTVLACDDIWQMKCNCESSKCRKIVKKFDSLPKKIKENYTKLGIVPGYILAIK